MKYKRVLLKFSGEALAGSKGHGVCPDILKSLSEEVLALWKKDLEIAIVIGGGNIHRGVAGTLHGLERTTSDYMGMLATVMNSLALQDALEKQGLKTRVMSAIEMNAVAEPYIRRKAVRHLEKRRVIIFAAGTGNPYFTTDTAAALRASEIDAEVLLKATKVGGVYDKDPAKHQDAKKFEKISASEVINDRLAAMDATAVTLCRENKLDIIVLNMFETGNIQKALSGDNIGTLIHHD